MSGDWKRGTVSGPQRLQSDAWTAPDLAATAPALDSDAEQVPRLIAPGRRLDQLAPDAGGRGVGGHVDLPQLAPAVSDDHEYVQCLEGGVGQRGQAVGP